jgi:tubulin-folding cofactor B
MDVTINVTSLLTNSHRRISTNWSIPHLKQRLETITGIPPNDQQLLLYPNAISSECIELNDTTLLPTLRLSESSRIQVNDTREDSELKQLEDQSVETYEMNDEEYDKRTNTVREWKRQNQLGKFNPEYNEKKQQMDELNESKGRELSVGSRFQANDGRRGTIKFVGKVPEIDNSVWAGVEFDEPQGKNDGSVKGVYYFQAKPNYGGFLKPSQVEMGDFPEEDLFSDDEI